ncbi:MAG: cell division protein FtsX [Candidatus Zixiibacteriota bacterium]
MTKLLFILKEFLRILYRNPGTALASILSLTLLFLLFELFWIAAETSDKIYSELLSNLQMHAYISESFPENDVDELTEIVKEIEGISSVNYISRDMARKELAGLVGTDLLVGYDEFNPLPRSLIIDFSKTHLKSLSIIEIEASLNKLQGVSKVDYSREWLEKAETTRNMILNIGMILGGLTLFTMVVSSANNIRLMTRTRAVGLWQMRLLGAGRTFIALPYILEGFLIGFLSAVFSWLVIMYGQNRISFTQFELVLPTFKEMTLFCLAAGALGIFSGLLGLRKLMK